MIANSLSTPSKAAQRAAAKVLTDADTAPEPTGIPALALNVAEFIDEAECLRRVPVSRKTWYSWRKAGKIPFIRQGGGRRVIYHWATVQAALLRQQETHQ